MINYMKKFVLCVVAGFMLGFVLDTLATTFSSFRLSWELPTQRVNGTALNPEEIKSFKLYYRLNGVDYDPVEIDYPAITYTIPTQGPGVYEFQISTVAIVGHNGESVVYGEGPKSNVLTIELESFYALPGAPTLNTVTLVDCDNCGLQVVQ